MKALATKLVEIYLASPSNHLRELNHVLDTKDQGARPDSPPLTPRSLPKSGLISLNVSQTPPGLPLLS